MKFTTAQAELDKLADGQYHVLGFKLLTNSDGTLETTCMVYVHGYDWYSGPTWREALGSLREAMEGYKQDIEEIPEVLDNQNG